GARAVVQPDVDERQRLRRPARCAGRRVSLAQARTRRRVLSRPRRQARDRDRRPRAGGSRAAAGDHDSTGRDAQADRARPHGRADGRTRERRSDGRLMPDLWTPVAELPHEAFVERLHKAIASFAETTGVEKPVVEVELSDGSRFVLERIEPEPGFGMVTLYVTDAREDAPEALIVPIGS